MTANTTPSFRRGGADAETAERAINDANRRRDGADYFSLKEDGEQTVVRLLTDHDDWIYVEQHSFVPTKPAPDGADPLPPAMTAVCRKDPSFQGHYSGCYICDNKIKNNFGKVASSRIRVWALAIERELVRGDGSEQLGGPTKEGAIVGVRDKIDEVEETDENGEPTGTTLRYPRVLIINQPMQGFFGGFKGLYGLYGTVCDRDYVITRDGTGTDTKYRINALDPLDDIRPGTAHWQAYRQALDEREISLEKTVADKATDYYYAKFFDPSRDIDDDGNVITVAAPPPAGLGADLRERIRNLGASS